MSLFSYDYGMAEPFNAILSGEGTVTLFTAGKQQAVVHTIRAAMTTSSTTTTLMLDIFDGTTAYQIRGAKALGAQEVVNDCMPIILPPGWSLRATRGAGDPIHVTGVVIAQVGS